MSAKIKTKLSAPSIATAGAKTQAAGVGKIASEYLGETEKNLTAAKASGLKPPATLLFDEADALFGQRSGVNDAHDRYANAPVVPPPPRAKVRKVLAKKKGS